MLPPPPRIRGSVAAVHAKLACMVYATRPSPVRGKPRSRYGVLLMICLCAAILTGCASPRAVTPAPTGPTPGPTPSRALIDRALAGALSDRAGWIADIDAGFAALGIAPNRERVCAVVAITEQ